MSLVASLPIPHIDSTGITDKSSVAETQKLLDKAIVMARRDVKSSRRPPALTPTRWVWRLAGFYHLCHSTPELMQTASQNFAAQGRKELAQWAAQKAREETGHDQLALMDIKSMGYQAEAVVEALFPPAAKTLVDYFTRSAHDPDPIDCLGYSYTAERLGICIGQGYIDSVEALLPRGIKATRCLQVHSAIGAEIKHVQENVSIIAQLTLEEQDRVAKACYQAASLRLNPPDQAYILDDELQEVLKPLKLKNKSEALNHNSIETSTDIEPHSLDIGDFAGLSLQNNLQILDDTELELERIMFEELGQGLPSDIPMCDW